MAVSRILKSALHGIVIAGLSISAAASNAQDDVFQSSFKEVRQTGFGLYGIFSVTNKSGKDIDDVRLSVYLKSTDGEILSATAITDATPGLVWQRDGEAIEVEIPLDRRPAAEAALEQHPDETVLEIIVEEIVYMN